MALLLLEDGRRFVEPAAINRELAPVRIDRVPVPAGVDDVLARPDIDDAGREALLAHRDPDLDRELAEAGWPPPLVQAFWPGMPDDLEATLASYGPPHTNPVDEVHHVVDGAVVFGVVRPDNSQALVVVQPGDALRVFAGVEHWSTLTDDHRVKAILYLSQPPGYAHAYTDTTIRLR